MKRLFHVLRGLSRVQGSSYRRVPRRPFTLDHLMYFLSFTAARFNPFDHLMLRAVACVAFFACCVVLSIPLSPLSLGTRLLI